ncbi:2Fe-2S iron-sulfur cluster-binding protein [Marinomonas algarum]|uniref:2Fe-2S iron-sulfur cluster binding domain-containing protein n=1 Tax=Marinomonas algarum TaxID=2883105 RepID=A0A9X1IJ85_9GAMM|nr:2Fe-2S iron-sulfur cluster binding domain-containing protein [Marinomonas algarum]MCB5160524.1 2Fe-2S iron-sulfur cluster binding domain-containing protein [Marinomonas algarum]
MSLQSLTINLDGTVIEAQAGDNLLSSLLEHNVDVRYGCRAGACGACRLYQCDSGDSLLSCQTSVTSDLLLTTKTLSKSVTFSLLSKKILDDFTVELTLLGPSDDSFGDRVSLCFAMGNEEFQYECMAINPVGESLTLLMQKSSLPAVVWQCIVNLSSNDPVQVICERGRRKGRLLYELGLDDCFAVVISSVENAGYTPYWEEALASFSTQLLGIYALPERANSASLLEDAHCTSFIADALSKVGSAPLHIIYHGQKLSEKDWGQVLRPLRIRSNQLHFVR